jgi:hypothetical protein
LKTTVPGLAGLVHVYQAEAPIDPPDGHELGSPASIVAPILFPVATMPEMAGDVIGMASAKLSLGGAACASLEAENDRKTVATAASSPNRMK